MALRGFVAGVCGWVVVTGVAAAQELPRIEVGPVVRVDRVQVENELSGVMPVTGVALSVRMLPALSIEGEITHATGTLRRHYSGWFVSFAQPGSSPEEIERLSPTARRDLAYEPGWGGAGAVVLRSRLSPRVDIGARIGLSGRRYVETSAFTILTIPPGVTEAQARAALIDSRRVASRGGALFGVDVPVRVTPRLRVIPELRFVLGPRQVGNAQREWSLGVRGAWGF